MQLLSVGFCNNELRHQWAHLLGKDPNDITPGSTSPPADQPVSEGEGNATHAGRTLTEGCVVFTPDPTDPSLLDFVGEGSGTAANGDVVEFDIVDGVSHVFSPPCAATYTIVFTRGFHHDTRRTGALRGLR